MDLYEALKAGTSEEELLNAFHKELNEANARIAEEAKNQKQEELAEARRFLAHAMTDYVNLILAEDGIADISEAEVESIISSVEKSVFKDCPLDEDIILSFLKALE